MPRPHSPLESYLERTLEMFEASGDVDGFALTALRLARLRHSLDVPVTQLQPLITRALDALTGYERNHLRARLFVAYAELGCGDPEHRQMALTEAEKLWSGHPPGLVAVELVRADWHVASGQLDDAAACHGRAAEILSTAGSDPNLVAEQTLIEASLHQLRRDPASAIAAIDRLDPDACLPRLRAALVELKGRALLEQGHAAKALEVARTGLAGEMNPEDEAHPVRVRLSLLLADAGLATGDIETAASALEAFPSADMNPVIKAHAALCRAEIQLTKGDTAAAIGHVQNAAHGLAEADSPPEALVDRLDDLQQALADVAP